MGIYDREYYRDDTGGSGWFSGLAPACKALILINVGAFVAQAVFREPLTAQFDGNSAAIFEKFQVYRLLTAAFLHDFNGPIHLVINMFVLWFAGRDMESMYGSREFVKMYLTAAVLGTTCWAVVDYFGPGPRASMVGSSGAVLAVLVLYTLYYPRREILVMFVLPVQMWLLLVIYLGYDALMLLQKFQGMGGSGVAVAAHLGGALYGYLYKQLDLRWSRLNISGYRRPRLRVVKPDSFAKDRDVEYELDRPLSSSAAGRPAGPSGPRPAPSVLHSEEQLDARLDEVLAKIAREGKAGLTDEENRILQEASRRARTRRSDRV